MNFLPVLRAQVTDYERKQLLVRKICKNTKNVEKFDSKVLTLDDNPYPCASSSASLQAFDELDSQLHQNGDKIFSFIEETSNSLAIFKGPQFAPIITFVMSRMAVKTSKPRPSHF